MKKSLLLTVVLGISVAAMAQKSPNMIKPGIPVSNSQTQSYDDVDLSNTPAVANFVRPNAKGTAEVSVVNLGTSANAYGLYNGGRTVLWAEPSINTVTFVHRMQTPGSGYIAYDVSKDGGNTWSVNNQVFNPTQGAFNARYPQGLIYNPQGNTNPDNAFFTGLWPVLDGSNGTAGSWGGYGTATVQLNGTNLSQDYWASVPPIRQNVPDAMTINPATGDIFVVDPSLIGGLGNQYVDTLVITRGSFNNATNEYDYTQTLLYAPVVAYGTSVADVRIAFSPDGQIGYIMTLSDNGRDEFATGYSFYPILYKTTDYGLTWDENPITVVLGGPEGIGGIVNGLLTDEQIGELFTAPVPNRDEIGYTTAFTSDFAVDYMGNPVISVVIGVQASTAYSIVSASGFFASYNLYGSGQGTDWWGQKLGNNLKTFRGTWGDVSEDNRSQVTTSYDGRYMFFSWLDTDFEGVEDNNQPDIYCIGWDIERNLYTEVFNVTYLSDAWLQAYMGTASFYALQPNTDAFIVPFVYQDFEDPAAPVQYKYIHDFTITMPQFIFINANNININSAVSQNYPNPFNGTSKVAVNLEKRASVSLDVYNMVGQKVYSIPSANYNAGSHELTINSKDLKAGIYTYTVMIDGQKVSRKMVVK